DRRTDIFAFGALLYEMLTGRAAFEGEDLQDILGAVLKSDPDWTRLPSGVPLRIRELLRLCLQKDAKKRRQTATDVRIDIEHAFDGRPEPRAPRVRAPRTGERLWRGGAGVFLMGMGALGVILFGEAPAVAPAEVRTDIVTPATSDPASFAISPDGR